MDDVSPFPATHQANKAPPFMRPVHQKFLKINIPHTKSSVDHNHDRIGRKRQELLTPKQGNLLD